MTEPSPDTCPPPSRAAGALDGVRILDLSRVLGGPYCTMILGDHGAEIIKVEPPQGDDTRGWGPPFAGTDAERGDASYFIGVNRNKRSMVLDLSRESGRAVLMRLLEDADVLVENFKPGTMEAWGLGYERDLAPRFPRLIHCRVSGFGGHGPLGNLPGYDAVLQAMSGLMSVNGTPETGPLRIGTPIVDLSTGLYATIGILMALHERRRSGLGQYVDMALYDCAMSLLHPHAANYFLDGSRPRLTGNTHPNVTPCDKFATRSGEIFVVIGTDRQFRRLVELLGIPDLAADPRFATNSDRSRNRAALYPLLAEALARHDGVALSRTLLAEGLPIGPVMGMDEALGADHTHARSMVYERDGYKGLGTPIKLSRTPGGLRRTPPTLAEHAREILREAGFTDADMDELERIGATAPRRAR
ncbi:MAG: carnitine dehydratase [Bordetella sp. SCN 67-23]|nr:CoA transferase [Burkholderiales bacterium]ODS72158.1 MAG: carnitine dehydratase [Bordetella sp. SCN 67-23]OJW92097.1 MAG: carnitine dehydratase [Burkholderiales bacterium 67-32]